MSSTGWIRCLLAIVAGVALPTVSLPLNSSTAFGANRPVGREEIVLEIDQQGEAGVELPLQKIVVRALQGAGVTVRSAASSQNPAIRVLKISMRYTSTESEYVEDRDRIFHLSGEFAGSITLVGQVPPVIRSLGGKSVPVRRETESVCLWNRPFYSALLNSSFLPDLAKLVTDTWGGREEDVYLAWIEFGDSEYWITQPALGLLLARGGDRLATLQPLLTHAAPEVRLQAVIALQEMDPLPPTSLFTGLLTDPATDVATWAVGALEKIGDAAALPALLAALRRPESKVRCAVLRVLEKFRSDPMVRDAILGAIEARDRDVHVLAVKVVPRIAAMMGKLIAIMGNPGEDDWARLYAAEALGEIGDQRAIPSLRRYRRSLNPGFWRDHVDAALKLLGVKIEK
jgi:HEAT repeat protein